MDNELKAKLYESLKNADSAEQIVELAKANNVELSCEEAKEIFEKLHAPKEISDDELDNVSGGCSGGDAAEQFDPDSLQARRRVVI